MKRHVCIVDDDDDVRDILAWALEDDGFHVSAFCNPEEALEELDSENPPGFIISDYIMPKMDGVTFINKLRKDFSDTLGKVPCAINSANGELEEKLPPGVLELRKPMDLDLFLDVVRDNCL